MRIRTYMLKHIRAGVYLRWILLIATIPFFFVIPLTEMQIIWLFSLFMFVVIYNLVLTSVFSRGYTSRWFEFICMSIDLFLITAVVLIDTGIHSFAWRFYLLVIIGAALRFDVFATISSAVMASLLLGGTLFLKERTPLFESNLALLYGKVLFLYLTAFAASYLSRAILKEVEEKESTERTATYLKKKVHELTLVEEIVTRSRVGIALDSLLHICVSPIVQETKAETGAILFLDENKQELVYQIVIGKQADKLEKTKLALSEGLAGLSAMESKSLRIDDICSNPDYLRRLTNLPGIILNSYICAPIKEKDRVIGVIELIDKKEGDHFNEDDVRLLNILAHHIGTIVTESRLHHELERRLSEISKIADFVYALNASLDLKQTLDLIMSKSLRTMDAKNGSLMLIDEDSGKMKIVSARGLPSNVIEETSQSLGEGIAGWVAEKGEPLLLFGAIDDNRFKGIKSFLKDAVSVPITLEDKTVGVLNLSNKRGAAFDYSDLALATVLANQAAIAIEKARLYEETRQKAISDGLTGLYNHTYFYESLESEFRRSKRYRRPLSLIILDIDDFKKYNDRFGHQIGDSALKVASDQLKKILRDSDIIARYGGDEFAAILPETDIFDAKTLAKRIYETFKKCSVGDKTIPITASIGVASAPKDAANPTDLIAKADMAMYSAKLQGKNRIQLFEEIEVG